MFKIPILLLINSKFLLLSLMVFGCLLILLGWDCGQRFRWRPVETHFHRTVTGPKTDSALAQGRATCVLILSEVASESINLLGPVASPVLAGLDTPLRTVAAADEKLRGPALAFTIGVG